MSQHTPAPPNNREDNTKTLRYHTHICNGTKIEIRKSQLIDNVSLWTHNDKVQLQEIKMQENKDSKMREEVTRRMLTSHIFHPYFLGFSLIYKGPISISHIALDCSLTHYNISFILIHYYYICTQYLIIKYSIVIRLVVGRSSVNGTLLCQTSNLHHERPKPLHG